MIKNYLRIAFRSLIKNKTYSLINLVGLSFGIAASLMIFLYVSHELSYDRCNKNIDRIFQLQGEMNMGGQKIHMSSMSSGFGRLLKENNPGVESFTRLKYPGRCVIQSDVQHINYENNGAFADTAFFSMFNFPFTAGSAHLLERGGTVAITKDFAKKYFGTQDAVGKTITYNQKTTLEVVGLLKDFPSNSSFKLDFVISFSTLGMIAEEKQLFEATSASLGNYPTFFMVSDPSFLADVKKSFVRFTDREQTFDFAKFAGTHAAGIPYLYLFMAVAFIILLLALVNYMNLTTARATMRSKEVGVRKVIGARRKQLALQFYLESALMTGFSFVLAAVWMELFLPLFLNTLQIQIDRSFITSPSFIGAVAALFVGCVFLSGSYPSIVLSRFHPAEVLKGRSVVAGGNWIRKSFTVFQFTVSIGLIIITLGIQHQLNFMRNQKLGFSKEQVMVINLDAGQVNKYAALKNSLRDLSGVKQVAAASLPLFTRGNDALSLKTPLTHDDIFMYILRVDENFLSTLGVEWIEKPDTLTKKGYILNEAALAELKITKADIGINLTINDELFPITGIVKNFNYESLRSKISGLIFSVVSDSTSMAGTSLYIKLDPIAALQQVEIIKKTFQQYQPDQPFEFYFLDDAFNKLYKSEDKLADIFNAFTGIAIVIACLGLLGLVTFAAEARTKEIGIRKVLGASVGSIFLMLSKEFILLTVSGVVFAIPVSWWYLLQWRQQFSYQATLPWWLAIIACMTALLISFVTISGQSFKSARANPVDALRSGE